MVLSNLAYAGPHCYLWGFVSGSVVKNLPANAGNAGSVPGWGRYPGGGNGNQLQYLRLWNPMDGGAWQATVHGGHKSQTQLNDWGHTIVCDTGLLPQPSVRGLPPSVCPSRPHSPAPKYTLPKALSPGKWTQYSGSLPPGFPKAWKNKLKMIAPYFLS